MKSQDEYNQHLYAASVDLLSAAKHIAVVDVRLASFVAKIADKMLGAMDVPVQKLSEDRINDILKEIFNAGVAK